MGDSNMSLWTRGFSLCALTLLLCTPSFAAADLASGVRAFNEAEQARKKGEQPAALKGYADALRDLTPFVKQGNAEAEAIVGKMYLMGLGVLKDPGQANQLFEEAAAQGNADAEFFLGAPAVMRHENIPQGLKMLRLSADQGNQDAQLLLGKAYLQGIGSDLPRESVQADMWLRLAANHNLPFYQNELRVAEGQMNEDEIAKGKALAEAWKPKHGLKPDDKTEALGKAGS
jgi:Sel1 repeat-containing protein